MKRLFTSCMLFAGILSTTATSGSGQGFRGTVTVGGQASVRLTGHSVALFWIASPGASSYNIYRGLTHGGPYTKIASADYNTTYTDVAITYGETLYYVTTAVNGSGESGYSGEAVAVLP